MANPNACQVRWETTSTALILCPSRRGRIAPRRLEIDEVPGDPGKHPAGAGAAVAIAEDRQAAVHVEACLLTGREVGVSAGIVSLERREECLPIGSAVHDVRIDDGLTDGDLIGQRHEFDDETLARRHIELKPDLAVRDVKKTPGGGLEWMPRRVVDVRHEYWSRRAAADGNGS